MHIHLYYFFFIDTHLIQWMHPAYHVIQLNRKWCYIVWNFVMGDMYVYWLNNTHIHTTHYQSGLGNYVTTFLINAHALLFSSCVITWRLLTFIWNITKKKKGQFQDKLILSQGYFHCISSEVHPAKDVCFREMECTELSKYLVCLCVEWIT